MVKEAKQTKNGKEASESAIPKIASSDCSKFVTCTVRCFNQERNDMLSRQGLVVKVEREKEVANLETMSQPSLTPYPYLYC